MEDSPQQRAARRSALLNADRRGSEAKTHLFEQLAFASDSKLPLGREPGTGSPDWAHRCGTQVARLVPNRGHPLTLHALGLPRPRTPAGWPMPFAGRDPADPCATDRELEMMCGRERRCQVCGLGIAPETAYVIRRPGHQYASLSEGMAPWVEGRAALHLGCLRFSLRYCPELIRQVRQGVAHVLRESSGARYRVLDGAMIDTCAYIGFVEPVWQFEVARDSEAASLVVLRQLENAASLNARATATLFPQLARREGI